MPALRTDQRYEIDDADGLRREVVHAWSVEEKHARLRRYVDICRAVRRKFRRYGRPAGYVDLYCGPGRARVEETGQVVDGSAVVAATEAQRHDPFSEVWVADADPVNLGACRARPMRSEWARSIREQCLQQGVLFFFKQWGSHGADGLRRSKKANGRVFDGRTWDQMPALAPAGN
jgi:hypothetical protein